MKDVIDLQYFTPMLKNKIIIYIKIVTSIISTVFLTFIIMNFLGAKITQSAQMLVFGQSYLQIKENTNSNEQNYYADFETFQSSNETEADTAPIVSNKENDAVAVNLSALSGKYADYGGTSVLNNTNYSVTSLLYDSYSLPELNKNDPYILIYHTHTSESYYDGGTVVDVGKTMAEEFEKHGYKTIHLTEVFDKEKFSGAYSRSVEGAKKVLEKYPSIKLVFDIHRDSITTSSGVTYRPLTEIEDQNCAQVMFVCGTDAKGLNHPNWRENFKFALDVSRTAGEIYGPISRPVNLRGDRFNTHLTNHSFLIEVGSDANFLDEAKLAAVYTARSIVKTIEK